MPPTRVARYCCEYLKERSGNDKIKVTGVRWAESIKRSLNSNVVQIIGKPKTTQKAADKLGVDYRVNSKNSLVMNDDNDKNRRFVEYCYRTTTIMLNPIVDWTDNDVWEFLKHYGCESNPLYQCGFKRIGCIGCPMAGKHRYTEFHLYPKYRQNYVKAFERMIKHRKEKGLETQWQNGEEVMKWWLGENPDQIMLWDE